MASDTPPDLMEVAMTSTIADPIDTTRLAALLARFEGPEDGACSVPGCVHNAPGAERPRLEPMEHALAA